ncbi:Calpain family cysteine protease [Phytophthora infestans]|uniref:Calpain family cysteine protease n=1 Tax=Phytophthora infestans TaxID=4787 RepID=A0A8S9V4S0_PHYIN|nr:Calpain family cysteine protease [Phytophthora infestans]KAF4146434.1 Calpain family cysteine protease [Phytophthora infestans]
MEAPEQVKKNSYAEVKSPNVKNAISLGQRENVPVYFHAQGTCLLDRSRESKAASRISGVGISPGEMRVGRLADAYVYGALSILSTSQLALSQVFPELSDDLVRPDLVEVGTVFPKEQQYNDEGVYAVRFWRNNRSRVVVVDGEHTEKLDECRHSPTKRGVKIKRVCPKIVLFVANA